MPRPSLIVIGSSAGGFEPLLRLVADLPATLPAALFVVQHIPADWPSALPEMLSRAGSLPARHPQDGDPIVAGHIYVAPPDYHLLVEGDRVAVKKGPKENRSRPAADPLFRSAAYTCGARVIGVVLSGLLSDGASGLWTIKQLGGRAVVQSPGDAQFDPMPRSALEATQVDYCVPHTELGTLLTRLVTEAQPKQAETLMDEQEQRRLAVEVSVAAEESGYQRGMTELGEPSLLTCPECHGVLLQLKEGPRTRYRCHTGHAYSSDALLLELTEEAEDKAYEVIRVLEEVEILLKDLRVHYQNMGKLEDAQAFLDKIKEVEVRTQAARKVALSNERLSEDRLRRAT